MFKFFEIKVSELTKNFRGELNDRYTQPHSLGDG